MRVTAPAPPTFDEQTVPKEALRAALEWLEQHGVNVIFSSVLGNKARRIELDLVTGTCSERTLGGQ